LPVLRSSSPLPAIFLVLIFNTLGSKNIRTHHCLRTHTILGLSYRLFQSMLSSGREISKARQAIQTKFKKK